MSQSQGIIEKKINNWRVSTESIKNSSRPVGDSNSNPSIDDEESKLKNNRSSFLNSISITDSQNKGEEDVSLESEERNAISGSFVKNDHPKKNIIDYQKISGVHQRVKSNNGPLVSKFISHIDNKQINEVRLQKEENLIKMENKSNTYLSQMKRLFDVKNNKDEAIKESSINDD